MDTQENAEQTQEQAEEYRLELDTEVLQKEDHVSTSLCDRFGIHMYSEEFLQKEQAYKQQKKETEEEIFEKVLNNERNSEAEETFQRVIQAEGTAVIKAEYKGTQEKDSLWLSAFYVLAGALIAGIVLFFIDKKRRKDHEDNNYDQK